MEQTITPGTIYIIWEVVKYFSKIEQRVEKRKLSSIIYNVLYSVSTRELVDNSIDWALNYNILGKDSGFLFLSEELKQADLSNSYSDLALYILKKYILKQKPYWLAFFSVDTDLSVSLITLPWLDLLESADLLNFNRSTTLSWWKDVTSKLEYSELEDTKLIGDIGEEQTLIYEKNRLLHEGHVLGEGSVIWISRFSDNYGYDISSLAGSLNTKNPDQKIMIEVKSTQLSSLTNFRFYLSRNEWETAIINIETYFFYFWIDVKSEESYRGTKPKPFVVSAKELIDLVPFDRSTDCRWIDAQIVLNLNEINKLLV